MLKKSVFILLLIISISVLLSPGSIIASADNSADPGSYNIIGTEDYNYALSLQPVKRYEQFNLDEEKVSFYMLGCDMVSSSAERMEFVIRNVDDGAKLVFIAPEAGRQSGEYSTADFYAHANAILRIKSTDKLIYEEINGQWHITIGENDRTPDMYLEDKNSWNEKLKFTENSDEPFRINLENYTLSRNGDNFNMHHSFSPSSPLNDIDIDTTISFQSNEIMFRSFETRLSADSTKSVIVADRKPSRTIIGSIIRFTSDSDDGDNLATVTGVDTNDNRIFISRHDSTSYNTHGEGTWLRCFADYGNGQVYDNEYPKVNLEPTTWSFTRDQYNALLNDIITNNDVTGLLGGFTIVMDDEDNFGYGLRNVTCSYDGLNFTGGLTGAFDLDLELDFFGRDLVVGPVRIDYSTMANSIMDQVLRINTYKREAFRFYFNPYMLQSYCDWGALPNPPDVFPLTFRLYFDKEFDLIGGNIKIDLPGNGLPLPGGLARVDRVGGGFTYPATFEVGAIFRDSGLDSLGVSFWNADVDAVLSLDRSYITMDGRIWMWDSRFKVGDASATVAWSYYKGKRFKGIEFSGETGVGTKKVNLVFDLTFKVKRYKSNGKTKSYIGGKGSGKIKAFGATFSGIGIKASTRKFSAYVNPPGPIGTKKVTVYYSKISSAKRQAQAYNPDSGIASLNDDAGNTVVLIPEAKRISLVPGQTSYYRAASKSPTTLNLTDATKQAAITVNYQGSISDITVELPDGTVSDVVISNETTVEEPGKLYGMDYELDDTERQLFIEINNATAGDYKLSYAADTVLETALYEIIQVPEIENGLVNASYSNDVVNVDWNLTEVINGDVKYHMTLQSINDGEVIDEYPIYENMVIDDDGDDIDNGEEVEVYVDDAALTVTGTHVSTRIKLPDNLPSGTYAIAVEPVLHRTDEEDLEGDVVTGNTFDYVNSNLASIVEPPSDVSVENTGNGVTRVQWALDPAVYSWDVTIRDTMGNTVGTVSVLSETLMVGQNVYIDPLSQRQYVYLNTGIESNTFASAIIPEALYNTDYTFEVTAVQRISHAGGDYYNSPFDYIDMSNIEADLNDNILVYKASSEQYTGRFTEPEPIRFYVEIYDNDSDTPLFSANAYEGDTGSIGYDYDFDSDLDLESLRKIDMGALVMRTNALDTFKLLPDSAVNKFGIMILSPSGKELLNIPVVSLSEFTQPGNWASVADEIANSYPDLSTDAIYTLQAIYESGAVTVEDVNTIRVNLEQLVSQTIMDGITSGRYTVSILAYNVNNDRSEIDFEISVRDIQPAPFIETITKTGSNSHLIEGLANGAVTISINGITADVTDGLFKLTAETVSEVLEYEVTDEFGSTYSGTIEFSEYNDYLEAFKDRSGDGPCFINSCFF